MLELYTLQAVQSKEHKTKKEKDAWVVAVIIYILFLVWAISRALKCSSKNPDSRAIHFMFMFTSPILYVVSSYAVPGFSKK